MSYTGTATNGVDYVTGTVNVTIPAGLTGNTFTVQAIDDQFFEGGNELFDVSIS